MDEESDPKKKNERCTCVAIQRFPWMHPGRAFMVPQPSKAWGLSTYLSDPDPESNQRFHETLHCTVADIFGINTISTTSILPPAHIGQKIYWTLKGSCCFSFSLLVSVLIWSITCIYKYFKTCLNFQISRKLIPQVCCRRIFLNLL